ncbi:hypothetical protein AKJ61_01240 [candidate division MSBL1 archaeon SCGC-AAA259B11]|uniref:Uncharacterized protein n=1 Tax=candidate division MSBL1 archaeon SCGC-AAA259B11 TaxID=1698260 RepID=A0A133U7N1_9EURY|nr:hypothetical protein AKJ61_01240 [candidate division MSBL1 archaeon SCGC-AAA259B11]
MKRKGHVIVLLAAVVCLVLVLGFLTFKNERERSITPSTSENLSTGKLAKGFEFSEGDYIQYETNNETRYGAMSGLYPLYLPVNLNDKIEVILLATIRPIPPKKKKTKSDKGTHGCGCIIFPEELTPPTKVT